MRTTGLMLLCLVTAAQAGPPLLTDDPDTPKLHGWEINVAALGAKQGGEWLLNTPLIDINYGLFDNVQLKYEQPWLTGAGTGVPHGGIGDSLFGVKWRFFDQGEGGLEISTYPQFSMNDSVRSAQRGLVPGGWQMLLPVEVQKKFGGTTLFDEVGYLVNEYGGNGLLWGAAFEQEVCEKFSLLGELHAISATGFRKDNIVFNLGFHWQTFEHAALIGSAGRAIHEGGQDGPQFLGYLGMQFTF
jgi:hypothetical protein